MMNEIPLLFDVALPPVKIIRAGSVSCMYELGNLRYIRWGDSEVVRMIYGAVRTENWETLPYALQDEEISLTESGFSIRYTAVYGRELPLYKAGFHLEGKADNTIIVSMKGEALGDFQKNRIGLCVLHPITACSGKTVMVMRPDGTRYQSSFTPQVNPSQPFYGIQEMEMVTSGKTRVLFTFEGDVFETEDQRNWSDSSYKTYSTPLDQPKPVNIQKGDTMEQRITLKVSAVPDPVPPTRQEVTREEKVSFPKIGYSRSLEQENFTTQEIEWLLKIPFDHYRVKLSIQEEGWQELLRQSLNEAHQLDTRLELIVSFSAGYKDELVSLLNTLDEQPALTRSILVLQKDQPVASASLMEYTYPIIKSKFPDINIGYGTDADFADLNRQRPDEVPCDFLSFSLHPQVHTFDTRSIMDNLESQPELLQTVASFAPEKPVCISPVTFKDRQNSNRGGEVHNNHATITGEDQRHHTWMAALWTLLSIQNLSSAYSITLYELFGDAGILQKSNGPEGITIIPTSPLYEVLATIQRFSPRWIVKRYAGGNLLMNGLLLENESGEQLFFKATGEALNYKDF